MTAIKFKITEIINQGLNNGPIIAKVEEIDFPTGKGDEKAKITTLKFGGGKVTEIKDIFATGKSYQMEFKETEVEDDRMPTATMNMCGKAGGSEPALPNTLIIQGSKELMVFYHNHGGSVKLAEETGTPTPTDPGTPKKQPDDPGTPKKQPDDPGTPKKQPDDPGTPKKPDNPGNPTPPKQPDEEPQPPKNPEPTSQQVNEAINKLNQAKNSGNPETIKTVLKEVSEIAAKSSDANLKKVKEETERKLGEVGSNEELRRIIREEVQKVLQENGIAPTDLSPTVKQKLDELNNNNNNNNNIEAGQAQAIRTEVCQETGIKTLEKLLSAVQNALQSKDKKQIQSKAQELQEFVDSNLDYKQYAYRSKKVETDQLLATAKQQSTQTQNNEGNFLRLNNPLMWVSGAAILGLVVGIGWVVRARQKKTE